MTFGRHLTSNNTELLCSLIFLWVIGSLGFGNSKGLLSSIVAGGSLINSSNF